MQPTSFPPAPGVQQQPSPSAAIRPSASWFGVAGGIAIVGIAAAIFLYVRTAVEFIDKIDDFERVSVPGESTVTLDGTGGYTIYHEYDGADEEFSGPNVTSVTLTGPDGSDVDLRSYNSTVTYSQGDHEGVALFSFDADEPGDYVLEASGEPSTMAVGRGLGSGLVRGIVWGTIAGLLGVIVGGVMAIVVGIRRGKDRRRRFPPTPRPPGYGYGYGVPPGYGPSGGYGPQAGASPPSWAPPPPPPPPEGFPR